MQIFSQVKFIRKNSLKFLCFLLLTAGGYWPCVLTCRAGVRTYSFNVKPPVNNIISDTLPVAKDTAVLQSDTTKKGGGADTLHIKYSKDTLDAAVKFTAKDSVVLSVPDKMFYLYRGVSTDYKDINLKAYKMSFDQTNGVLKAMVELDSAGNETGERVVFKQGSEQPIQSDTMLYNFKTRRGKIYSVVTQQGEGYIYSKQVKREADNSLNNYKVAFTTCDVDPPHFDFRANKVKIIPNKLLISGPANLEVEGIPTPLFIPFAIFPLTHGQRTGILPPTYTVSQQKGLGLENGGYYFGLGQYFDLTLRAAVYSYGSWTLDINPTYRKRYHYSGAFDLSIATTRYGDPQTSDFFKSKDFRVTWSHSMDSKAYPGVTFSASVNAGTSTYNQFNVIDPAARLNNTLSSSISFSKNWQGLPFNLTLSANHSQNTSTRQVNISLPDAAFTMNTIYPFQSQSMVGTPKWYQKLGIGYTLNARNSVNFLDTTFLKPGFFNRFQAGVENQIPISLTLPSTKFLTISPSVSFTERWYTQKLFEDFNGKTNHLDTSYARGFYTANYVTTGLSLSSAVYGMFQFNKHNKDAKIQAIRHVMRPSLSINYTPDLNAPYYRTIRVDTSNKVPLQRVSVFDGSVFGPFPEGTFGGLSFGLDNNLEMKVFSKKDTATHSKKIKLLDGFGINSSYNFMADSFKLSPFSIYARTMLFDKLNISANGTVDPYEYDQYGRRMKEYVWQAGQRSLGTLRNGSVSISTSFKSPERKNKTEGGPVDGDTTRNIPGTNPVQQEEDRLRRKQQNPGDYADFNIPWSLNLSYSLNFNKSRTTDYKRDTTIYAQYLNFSGDFNLTPKWKVSLTSGYDFIHGQLGYTTAAITRDLHCWRLSISVVPLGFYRSFSITLSPNAGILHDLRINRTRQFYDVFGNQ